MNDEPKYRKREYLSISTLLQFARCPRRYMYQKMGIESAESSVTALEYGTAMHKAIPHAIRGDLDGAFAAFGSVWDDDLADKKRNLVNARRSLGHAVHLHTGGRCIFNNLLPPPDAGAEIPRDKETSPFEIAFAIDVGLPIPIAGRIDGWTTHRDDGTYWGYEFKTAARMSASFFDGFTMNPQILTYALILSTISGKKIEGIMVEGMLCDAKKVDSMVHPIRIPEHLLVAQRTWLQYYGSHLLACEEQYNAELAKTEDARTPEVFFPQNFAGCSAYPWFYMSSWPCEFQPLCQVEDYKLLLPMFRIKPEHEFVELAVKST